MTADCLLFIDVYLGLLFLAHSRNAIVYSQMNIYALNKQVVILKGAPFHHVDTNLPAANVYPFGNSRIYAFFLCQDGAHQ